jgi:L-ascorbate metabolism protein UlaG (beta-lactamase superfamily)
VLQLPEARVYFACDTALFSDMRLIAAAGVDLAVLPIGDMFTMGPDDAVEAVKLIQPRRVAPAHYNTWPPIAQDAREPIVLEPGGTITL